jgi:hypothetical protein
MNSVFSYQYRPAYPPAQSFPSSTELQNHQVRKNDRYFELHRDFAASNKVGHILSSEYRLRKTTFDLSHLDEAIGGIQ